MKIFIIRHSETKKNIDNKFDNPNFSDCLTSKGIIQLSNIVKFLKKQNVQFNCIYSSSRKRCLFSAQNIATDLKLNLLIRDVLDPIYAGDLAGLTEKEAWDKYPDLMKKRISFKDGLLDGYQIIFPNGDDIADYENKINSFWVDILDNGKLNKNYIVVAHRSTILASLNYFYKKLMNYEKNIYHYFLTPDGMINLIEFVNNEAKIYDFGSYNNWLKTI